MVNGAVMLPSAKLVSVIHLIQRLCFSIFSIFFTRMVKVPWWKTPLKCLPSSFAAGCRDPGGIPNSERSQTTGPYRVGSQVTYTCNSCYEGGGTINCQSNNEWSQFPSCNCRCFPQNYYLSTYPQIIWSIMKFKKMSVFGTTLKTKKHFNIRCIIIVAYADLKSLHENTSYIIIEELILAVVSCGNPPSVANSARQPTFGPNTCNSAYTYSCASGYNLEGNTRVTCGTDRRWSQAPFCRQGTFYELILAIYIYPSLNEWKSIHQYAFLVWQALTAICVRFHDPGPGPGPGSGKWVSREGGVSHGPRNASRTDPGIWGYI